MSIMSLCRQIGDGDFNAPESAKGRYSPAHAYAKGEKSNLSDAEKNELKSTLATFADDYRKMVQGKVREMKRTEVAS